MQLALRQDQPQNREARTALVLPRRASALESEAIARASVPDRCLIVRTRGRRAGAGEDLVAELLGAGVAVAVIPALSTLHPSPTRALALVGALTIAGVKVVSINEPWLSTVHSPTLASIS